MLVLTRNRNQSVVIGKAGKIKIRVLETSGNQVRLGITAPDDIEVDREEVFNRKQAERSRRGCAGRSVEIEWE